MPAPRLDKRDLDEVQRQSRELATIYVPGWTGAGAEGDPAEAMLGLFGRLMEILLSRFNQVPDKNSLAFLEMVGVEPFAGAPARAPVTFVPSAKALAGGEVPARTQVATTQTETANAHVFETLASFHATAARLLKVVNVVPASDGHSVSALPETPPPVEALTDLLRVVTLLDAGAPGLTPLPHRLYLGSQTLFGRDEPVDVEVTLHATSGASLLTAANLEVRSFDLESDDWLPLAPPVVSVTPGGVTLGLANLAGVEASEVEGVEDHWIAIDYVGDLGGAPPPSIDTAFGTIGPVGGGTAAVSAAAGLFNSTALDLSKPFQPLGERPKYGDAFYIGSDVAFSNEVSDVTVELELRPYTVAELQDVFANIPQNVTLETVVEWQYLAADGEWKVLGRTSTPAIFRRTQTIGAATPPTIGAPTVERDGAATATEDGSLLAFGTNPTRFDAVLAGDMGRGEVGGVESFWIRGLVKSVDPYGEEGFVIPGATSTDPPTVVGPTFLPPVVEKLTLRYTHRANPHLIERIVATNNELVEVLAPAPGSATPIFVAPQDQAVDGVAFFAPESAVYLAFDRPFGNRYTTIFFHLEEAPATISSPLETGDPQIAWEFLDLDGVWRSLAVDDGTENLTTSGTVGFLAPAETRAAGALPLLFAADEEQAPTYWYRARLAAGGYDYPPQLLGVYLNTVLAENGVTEAELLAGSANGEPDQRIVLVKKPVLAGELWVREPEVPAAPELEELERAHQERARLTGDHEPLEEPVDVPEAAAPESEPWVRWLRVPNFLSSGPRDRHYTLDPVNGVLRFGDGERGLVPPIGRDSLVMRDLVTGGGERANRDAAPLAIKELKSSLPFIDKCFNVVGAVGGADSWDLEATMRFGPQVVKNRGRAVTTEDYEWMVRERFSEVARARCLATTQPLAAGGLGFRPGAITMIVVPKGPQRLPRPSNGLLRAIEAFLMENVLGSIVAEVYAVGPDFRSVEVAATVAPVELRDGARVARRVGEALEVFFHPLTGGEDGAGWGFGRSVYLSEIYAVIERAAGVDFARRASFVEDPVATRLTVGPNALVASGLHQVTAS